MKQTLSQFFAVALLLSLCSLCLPTGVQAQTALKIGILPVLDTLPLQVAAREGLFAERDLAVELVPFASALERDTAMQSGQLDGYFGDILNTLMLIENGVPMRIVTVSYATAPGQRMFALLRGAKTDPAAKKLGVGISQATIIEYLLDRMRTLPVLQDYELEATEVKQIPIRMQMLTGGQLDAALLPEPLARLAETEGAVVLASDEELGMPLTVVCLHEKHKKAAGAFLKAYGEAVKRINKDPESYRELMVETCRVPKPLAPDFPVYSFPKPSLPSEQEIWPVQQWMLTRGLLGAMPPYKNLVF